MILINGIDNSVKVMMSLRRPKRILIYASDQKHYYFLVKGAEDLRIDQKIQHSFDLINSQNYSNNL